jgi:hypothetical protein
VIEHLLRRLKSLGIENIVDTYTARPTVVTLDDHINTLYHS